MNNKFFLLTILMTINIESHSLARKLFKVCKTATVAHRNKSYHPLQNTLYPQSEIDRTNAPILKADIPSYCTEQKFCETVTPYIEKEQAKEEKVHGLQKSDYDYLNSCHPKFLATVVKIKEWSPSAVDWLAWTNKKLVKNWITQLDEKQAILFCQIKNSADETFEEFLQKTSTLKALFEEARREFQERTQNRPNICAN